METSIAPAPSPSNPNATPKVAAFPASAGRPRARQNDNDDTAATMPVPNLAIRTPDVLRQPRDSRRPAFTRWKVHCVSEALEGYAEYLGKENRGAVLVRASRNHRN